MTREEQNLGMKVVEPLVERLVLAFRHNRPYVWIEPFSWVDNKPYRYVVCKDDGRAYLFKEDGFFGWTTDGRDRKRNSFKTIEAARACFDRYYGHWRPENGYKVCLLAGQFHAGRSIKTISDYFTVGEFAELLKYERGRKLVRTHMNDRAGIGIGYWNGSKLVLTDGSERHCNIDVWYVMSTVNNLLEEAGIVKEFSMELEPFRKFHGEYLDFITEDPEYEAEHADEIAETRQRFREFVKITYPEVYEKAFPEKKIRNNETSWL